jgi:hypothetical protein
MEPTAPNLEVKPALSLGHRLLVIGAACVLALAINHAFGNWVLFTDALFRRFLF